MRIIFQTNPFLSLDFHFFCFIRSSVNYKNKTNTFMNHARNIIMAHRTSVLGRKMKSEIKSLLHALWNWPYMYIAYCILHMYVHSWCLNAFDQCFMKHKLASSSDLWVNRTSNIFKKRHAALAYFVFFFNFFACVFDVRMWIFI